MKNSLKVIGATGLTLVFALSGADALFGATIAKPANNLGLAGFWAFDEGTSTSAGDYSGNGNGGTLTNMDALTDWVSGVRGRALDFDGSNDYVFISDSSSLDLSNNFTVSMWVYLRANGGQTFILKGDGAVSGASLSYGWNGNGFMFIGWNSCNAPFAPLQASDLNQWHHIVGVVSGGVRSLYVDGVLAGTPTSCGTSSWNNSNNLMIGGNSVNSNFVNSKIDDVRVYNRVLSAGEIQALFRANQTTRKTANNAGLVAYWPFNEGEGLLAGDVSGNNYGGTLTNGPTWVNGKRGKALSLDNTDDYVNVGDQPNLDFGTGDFTIAAFQTKNTNTARVLVEKRGSGLIGYMLAEEYPSTGNVTLFLNDTSVSQKTYTFPAASLSQFAADTWFHIAVVVKRSTNTAYLYLNGVQVSSVSIAGTTGSVNSDASFRIGYDAGGVKFNGKIDDMRMYNRALSDEEVAVIYKSNETKVNAPQNIKMTDGLVGYWTFNGKDLTSSVASDVSGQGNNGNLSGPPTPAIGKVGQALSFNGTSAQVEIPYVAALAPTSAVSFGGWFKSSDLTGGQRILSKTETGGFQLSLNENGVCTVSTLCAAVYVGGYHKADYAISNLSTNEWYHAFGTYDGETVRLYVNGIEVASSASPSGNIGYSTTNSLCIGSEPGAVCNAGSYFKGSLDEIRIYNRALSAAEVKQLYLMGK